MELEFLTSNFEVSSLEITRLYRHRWQIEAFFKWIKQNLTIKSLWGHSENAVNIHIWVYYMYISDYSDGQTQTQKHALCL